MIELDGVPYTVATAQENADAAIRFINQFCTDNQIKNTKGEVVQLEIAPASPLYLILLGFGYLASLCQNLIYNLGRSNSIGSCTDRQLLALGEMARMRRKAESYTTIKALVYASAEGPCQVLRLHTVSLVSGNQKVVFAPLFEVNIPPDSVGVVMFQAQSLGAFFIEAGAIQSFDANPPNMMKIISDTSIPGRPLESFSQFRLRMQQRNLIYSPVERAIEALRNLDGISAANIFFNFGITPVTEQGYNVDPRTALIFIQGYNDDIAKTVLSHLLCETMPSGISQQYTMLNGQVRTISWEPPVFKQVFVKVLVRQEVSFELEESIRTSIQSLAIGKNMADILSSSDIFTVINQQLPDVKIIGAEVSFSGATWSQQVTAGSNELFEFLRGNILVESV